MKSQCDLIPIQNNPSEVFNYQWAFEDGTILGNTRILQNIPRSGKYTITMTNPVTLCSRQITVNVKTADSPNLTSDDVKIDDLQDNNAVTILNPSSLGNSTYIYIYILLYQMMIEPFFLIKKVQFLTMLEQDFTPFLLKI